MFFPLTGASFLRKPDLTNIVHWEVSYKDEGKALTKYAIEKLNAKSFAVLYQEDVYGRSGFQGVKEVFQEFKINDIVELPYERNTSDFKV